MPIRSVGESGNSRKELRRIAVALPFLSLNIIGFLVFVLGAVVWAFYISLTEWNLLTPPHFLGLANYGKLLFRDELIWISLKNTLYYTVISVPLGMFASLVLALLLNVEGLRFGNFFKVVLYLPVVTSTVSMSLLWRWIYNRNFGIINWLLGHVGILPIGWLSEPGLVVPSIAIMGIWKGMGGGMIIFLAGLSGIPRELYEAAEIDGARWFRKTTAITLPLLTPVFLFSLVTSVIGSFQVFDQIYIMTQGGPGNASRMFTYYLFENAFHFLKMGYASAMAYVLFIIILVITLLQMKYLGGITQYELV